MISTLCRLIRSSDAVAAVESAIFLPVYLVLTLGVTDVGTGMFVSMQTNAATQAGTAYAVIHYPNSGVCASMSATCLAGIKTAINDATGNSSFCSTATCTGSFTACADTNGGVCFTVSVSFPYTPILPSSFYSWAKAMTLSSTATVRVPTT